MWQCTWWPKKWGRLVWILDSLKSAIDLCDFWHLLNKQELSYRKQIARKLRTQFVEGISVTLKSRLRITQGHWKRNHSVDHTRLTISRVIWRWILSWPWNVGQRSLKIIENGTIWKRGYGFIFAFHIYKYSNYGRICSHFGDIQGQRMIWPWNLGLGSFKVIEIAWFDRPCMTCYLSAIVTCTVCELFDVE